MHVSRAVNSETFSVTTPSDREIRMTRLFDAPPALVFEAMSKPEHIKEWWGRLGEGYSVPECEVDLRVGGKWRFVNQTPTGLRAVFYGEYREVNPPGRMVFTEIFEQFPDTESVVTAELIEEHGKTRFIATISYPTMQVRDMVMGTGMARGAATSYDMLEALVERLARNN